MTRKKLKFYYLSLTLLSHKKDMVNYIKSANKTFKTKSLRKIKNKDVKELQDVNELQDQDIKVSSEDCPVCYESKSLKQLNPCSHHLCEQCIRTIFNYSHSCPMCRQNITGVDDLTLIQFTASNLEERLRLQKMEQRRQTRLTNMLLDELQTLHQQHYQEIEQLNQQIQQLKRRHTLILRDANRRLERQQIVERRERKKTDMMSSELARVRRVPL